MVGGWGGEVRVWMKCVQVAGGYNMGPVAAVWLDDACSTIILYFFLKQYFHGLRCEF